MYLTLFQVGFVLLVCRIESNGNRTMYLFSSSSIQIAKYYSLIGRVGIEYCAKQYFSQSKMLFSREILGKMYGANKLRWSESTNILYGFVLFIEIALYLYQLRCSLTVIRSYLVRMNFSEMIKVNKLWTCPPERRIRSIFDD